MIFRKSIFNFIKKLANTKGLSLNEWITLTNKNLSNNGVKLKINSENGNVLIDDYFSSSLNSKNTHPFYFGTVHSVKGKTFEAVLLLLGKRAGSNYSTILEKDSSELSDKLKEELRIVYVGITRPEKILLMAVPNSDSEIWKNKMT